RRACRRWSWQPPAIVNGSRLSTAGPHIITAPPCRLRGSPVRFQSVAAPERRVSPCFPSVSPSILGKQFEQKKPVIIALLSKWGAWCSYGSVKKRAFGRGSENLRLALLNLGRVCRDRSRMNADTARHPAPAALVLTGSRHRERLMAH